MRNTARLLVLALCGLVSAQAGESSIERKEFKQSPSYPYVFRPVCYLATSGPVPLRFSVSPPECGERRPPKLPDHARNTPKPTPPIPPATPEPAPAPIISTPAPSPTPAPAYPPPTNAPAPKPPTVDFSQFPAELVEAFKKGRESSETRNYLFDPIFVPAVPDDLPKSKATLKER